MSSPRRWTAWIRIPATLSPESCILPWPVPGSSPAVSSICLSRWSSPPLPPPSSMPPGCSPPPAFADSTSRSWSSVSVFPPGSLSVSSHTSPSGRPLSQCPEQKSWPSSAPGPAISPWGTPGTFQGCWPGSCNHPGGTEVSGQPGTEESLQGLDTDHEWRLHGPVDSTHRENVRQRQLQEQLPQSGSYFIFFSR